MTSQLDIFRAFFLFFFHPLDPKSEKITINQLIKKFWSKSKMVYQLPLILTALLHVDLINTGSISFRTNRKFLIACPWTSTNVLS